MAECMQFDKQKEKFFAQTFCLFSFLLFSGCGKDTGVNSPAMNEPLSGKIADHVWKIQFGTVRRKVFDSYAVTLFDVAAGQDPCTAKYSVGEPLHMVSFTLKDLSVAEYDTKSGSGKAVSLTKAVTTFGGDLTVTTHGAYGDARLTKSDAQSIEGQLDVRANGSNYVRGKFTAKICP